MKQKPFIRSIIFLSVFFVIGTAGAADALQAISKTPYLGAIVIDAATGDVISEDQADAKGYPASMIKLMNLLVILDAIKAGQIGLQDPVTISAAVSHIGGSQVYLKENEVFPVEELIYAMMVQSANDAALALAIHCAGSPEAFVEMMNKKAAEIGMKDTVYYSVHGLPPGKDQQPDVTTARDMAKLCRELLKHPETLKYTSTQMREFRPDAPEPFIMRTHNHLLQHFEGCDGFKTGYYGAAGFSIAATAQKNGARAIAVVLGSTGRKLRDEKASILLSKGLMEILKKHPAPPPAAKAATATDAAAATAAPVKAAAAEPAAKKSEPVTISRRTFYIVLGLNVLVIALLIAGLLVKRKKNNRPLMRI